MASRVYTIREVAALERVGENTIRREIARGRLRAYRVSARVIRIPEAWLEEYRQRRQVAADEFADEPMGSTGSRGQSVGGKPARHMGFGRPW